MKCIKYNYMTLRTCFSAHWPVVIEMCCKHCGCIYFLAEFTLCPHLITVYIMLKSIFIACSSVQWCRQMVHLQILQCGATSADVSPP